MKMMKGFAVLLLAGLSAGSHAEGYFGIDLGTSIFPTYINQANTAALTGVGAGTWTANTVESGKISLGIHGGAFVNDSFGFEGGWKYLGGRAGSTNLTGPNFNRTDNYSVTGSTLYGAAIGRVKTNGDAYLFGKLGMHFTSVTMTTDGIGNILSRGAQTTSAVSNGLMYGIGFNFGGGMKIGLDMYSGVKMPKMTWPVPVGTSNSTITNFYFGLDFQ
jgi:Outer membrane protein beta-barrel domain